MVIRLQITAETKSQDNKNKVGSVLSGPQRIVGPPTLPLGMKASYSLHTIIVYFIKLLDF